MTAHTPIDPAGSPTWALRGRILTMDPAATVIDDGVLWVADSRIAALTAAADPAPEAFGGVTPVDSGGTILPA